LQRFVAGGQVARRSLSCQCYNSSQAKRFRSRRNAMRRTIISTVAGAAITAMNCAASAQTQLKVIVFPTLSNLAQFAAQSQGYYSKRGLAVDLIYTPSSEELRSGLAPRRYQIAHGGA